MARRNKHTPEEIKAMVLCAAKAIVIEQGGSALTVRKIAQRIGYTVGSVYMVFENMADVIRHINEQTLENLFRDLAQVQGHDLQALGCAYLGFVKQNYHCWCLWSESQANGQHTSESYQAKVDALINLIGSHLPNTETPGLKRQLAKTLWGSMQGVCATQLGNGADNFREVEGNLRILTGLFCYKPSLTRIRTS